MSYQTIIDDMPLGLDKAILRALSYHIGKESAIERNNLLLTIREIPLSGFDSVEDRQIRKSIETLRRKGARICNEVKGDGYFIAANEQEYQEFRLKYTAYARSIFITAKAMDECREIEIKDGEIIELDPVEFQLMLI